MGYTDMTSRTWAEISLENLTHNYQTLKHLLGEKIEVLGIVKADAYGHGALTVANRLAQLGVRLFAVACLDEARALRQAGFNQPLLVFGVTPLSQVQQAFELDVAITINALDYASSLATRLQPGQRIKAHIKLDTGMSRHGFLCDDGIVDQLLKLFEYDAISVEGIYTHLSQADDTSEAAGQYTEGQLAAFWHVVHALEAEGKTGLLTHVCNSAGVLRGLCAGCDFARPGIALYGMAPCAHLAKIVDLRPVMTLNTRVSLVKTFPKGTNIGYNGTYIAPNTMEIAILPIGYADGYPRALSNKGWVSIHGKQAKIVGRICMDQMLVDVTGMEVKVGDVVQLFGEAVSATSLADAADTISYELVSALGKRVPRVVKE